MIDALLGGAQEHETSGTHRTKPLSSATTARCAARIDLTRETSSHPATKLPTRISGSSLAGAECAR